MTRKPCSRSSTGCAPWRLRARAARAGAVHAHRRRGARLPAYAPNHLHSTVHVALARGRTVRGITVFLFPALDYRGRVVDAHVAPAPGAHVRLLGTPAGEQMIDRLDTEWTTDRDGRFTFHAADGAVLEAEAEDRAPAALAGIRGGSRDVTLTLDTGLAIAGQVLDGNGAPAAACTLLVFRPEGVARRLIVARSLVDPRGRFEVRVPAGSYELVASAPGWAPSAPTRAAAGATDVTLTLSTGATLRGTVVDAADQRPIGHARIAREASSGGASIQPANAGALTRPDGTFELTGIPPGALSVTITATGFNLRIESGMTASDGAALGPITVGLTRLVEGAQPSTELVGIGIVFTADGDELRVTRIIAGGGAEAAGIVIGDRVTAIDGLPVAPLGVDGAVSKIRGIEGTTITVTVHRGDQRVPLIVTRQKLRT